MTTRRAAPRLLSALTLTFAAVAQPALAQVGVAAGLNYADLENIDVGSASATYDNSTGFHFGAFVNLGGSSLSLRPGVMYHRIGTYTLPNQNELTLAAIEVPVDVKLTIAPSGILDAYLLAAPVVTFPRCKEREEAVKDWQVTSDVGVGLSLRVPGLGVTLMPEARYSLGLTDYWSESFEVDGVTVMPDDSERRISRFMLRLNVML
jgi:hypothetical protein